LTGDVEPADDDRSREALSAKSDSVETVCVGRFDGDIGLAAAAVRAGKTTDGAAFVKLGAFEAV